MTDPSRSRDILLRGSLPLLIAGFVAAGPTACGDDDGSQNNNNDNGNGNVALCGNGQVEGAEECDDGAQNSDTLPDACRNNCVLPRCGDGVADSGEACDDGPGNSDSVSDACRTTCVLPRCGDQVVDVLLGEGCDCGDATRVRPDCAAGNGEPGSPCSASCVAIFCGNGVMDPGEVCDDGNFLSGDGCSADCQSEEWCGNGYLDAVRGEECDQGAANSNAPDAYCRTSCRIGGCGDGILDTGEECDDATGNSDTLADACRTNCRLPHCGDGVQDATEVCDDGNTLNGDGCGAFCDSDETCGNGVVDLSGNETCDDGGLQSGDGCSAQCHQEFGYYCSGSPSDCRPRCGDEIRAGGEACDDGNDVDDDGCSATCEMEPGYGCAGEPSQCFCVRYVDQDPGITVRDGLTWATALATVQEGVYAAAAADIGCEVWIAEGTYYTFETAVTDTIALVFGSALYGGFAGTETHRDDRDPIQHETILHAADGPGLSQRVDVVVWGADSTLLDGLTIEGANTATYGYGARFQGALATVRGCTFRDNWVGLRGFGNVRVDDCRFEGSGPGVGIYARPGGTFDVRQSQFIGVASGIGTGEEVQLTVRGCLFDGNVTGVTAGHGDSAENQDGARVTVYASRFVNNTASALFLRGDHDHLESSYVWVHDSVFADNTGDEGAAIYVEAEGRLTVEGTLFANNAATGEGGAIYVEPWGTAGLFSSVLAGNSAAGAAGTTYGGGAIMAYGEVELTDSVLVGNSAVARGGAVSFEFFNDLNFDVDLQRVIFAGNAANYGGAIWMGDEGDLQLWAVVLAGNLATNGGDGGAVYSRSDSADGGSTDLFHCTVYGNRAEDDGGGVYISGNDIDLHSSLVWANTAGGSDPGVWGTPDVVNYSDIQDRSFSGDGNLRVDPGLRSAPSDTGPWTGLSYDPTTFRTTLTDSAANWTPGALVGLFVQPDAADPRLCPIVANTATTLEIWGRAADWLTGLAVGTSYALFDLHLGAGSPCLEVGWGYPGYIKDVESQDPYDDPAVTETGGGDPVYTDIGAYERQP